MLNEVLDYIHNYFEKKIVKGVFSILNGQIDNGAHYLQGGQYYRIVGSVFNDGIWQYGEDVLQDEAFTGEVWCLAIPPRLIKLVKDIEDWNTKNKDVIASPFQSESFGGYSYTKASGSAGNGNNGAYSWRDVFSTQLNHWRKII